MLFYLIKKIIDRNFSGIFSEKKINLHKFWFVNEDIIDKIIINKLVNFINLCFAVIYS